MTKENDKPMLEWLRADAKKILDNYKSGTETNESLFIKNLMVFKNKNEVLELVYIPLPKNPWDRQN